MRKYHLRELECGFYTYSQLQGMLPPQLICSYIFLSLFQMRTSILKCWLDFIFYWDAGESGAAVLISKFTEIVWFHLDQQTTSNTRLQIVTQLSSDKIVCKVVVQLK